MLGLQVKQQEDISNSLLIIRGEFQVPVLLPVHTFGAFGYGIFCTRLCQQLQWVTLQHITQE
jgi:hypothetical protein